MCAPNRQWLPALPAALRPLAGFSLGGVVDLCWICLAASEVDRPLGGITAKSTWSVSLHRWLEHDNTGWGPGHRTSTAVWRHQGPRWTRFSCSLPRARRNACPAKGRVLLSVISLSHCRHSWHKSLQVRLFVHSLIPPLRSLFVFSFSFWGAGAAPCSSSFPPETQAEKFLFGCRQGPWHMPWAALDGPCPASPLHPQKHHIQHPSTSRSNAAAERQGRGGGGGGLFRNDVSSPQKG